jgi:NAD(P)-dependent dehydrogenase (short-subunit alcohol dehydrogenase family)
MKNLEGRVAVVTGAASGLGRAMANRFAAEGMRVVLSDIETDALDLAVTALSDAGHDVRGVVTDVADETAVQRLADEAFAIYGAVHVLCNNAGVNKRARIWELTTDDWNWVINVDLWSVVHGVRAFIPRMIELGQGGHIINTASMAALLPMPNLGAYAVAKAGVMALSEALQLELDEAQCGINVSLLAPGWIPTNIAKSARNRPAELSAVAPSHGRSTTTGVQPTMTADDVADQVLAAVRTDRFWILTHDIYRAVIRERAAGIGTDARPHIPPIH